jgi:NADH-quinone oxidoreductase subunit G
LWIENQYWTRLHLLCRKVKESSVSDLDNFYHGVSDDEHDLAKVVIDILSNGSTPSATIHEVEHADAVFILGEDLTNTAPRLALAVRQAGKRKMIDEITATGIPEWQDAAVREIIQDKNGPVFIATSTATKLDDAALETYRAAPEDIARLGFAVAQCIEKGNTDVDGLSQDDVDRAQRIAASLQKAKRPVIISGLSYETEALLKAAANIAWALHKKNELARICFTLPDSNSLGLAMMGGHRLGDGFDAILNGLADTVIIMENDLYRHGKGHKIEEFLKRVKTLVVIDHVNHKTMQHAHIVLPAGTFAESDGMFVNNEGRAQRFFQVFESKDVFQESWRWILNIGALMGNKH